MGARAIAVRRATRRTMRVTPLDRAERERLLQTAAYEGNPSHKQNPGDFGLTPPAAARADKTLCDEAGVVCRSRAEELLKAAIDRGLASEAMAEGGFPKHLWVVDDGGRVFEAAYGGSKPGRYHGYPIRRSDPLFDEVIAAWKKGQCRN
jgi:hypothetical protein